MTYFLVRASIQLNEPRLDDQGRKIPGAGQVFGVLAEDDADAKAIVVAATPDGFVDWDDSEIEVMDQARLAERTFALAATKASPRSIWWQTGRIYYREDGH